MSDSTTPAPPSKVCYKCRQGLPLASFGRDKTKKSGHDSACRQCENARKRDYVDANRAAHTARCVDWARRNREKTRDIAKRSYERNIDRERERDREYRAANPEKRREAVRRSNRKHADRRRAYGREYRARNRERCAANVRAYDAAHPENVRERASRRRALKRATQVGPVDYRLIWERDGGICYLCGLPVVARDLHFDHVIPLSKGGPHTVANIRVTHARCNQRKHARLLP